MARMLPPVSMMRAHVAGGGPGPDPYLLTSPYDFEYDSDGDEKGVLFFLGTELGVEEDWSNPHTLGQVVVTKRSGPTGDPTGDGGPETIVDRVENNHYVGNAPNNYIAIDLGVDRSLVLSKYSVRNRGEPYGDRPLRTWRMQGSNDAVDNTIANLDAATWDNIDIKAGNTTMTTVPGAITTYTPSVGNTTPYRWIRLLQDGTNGSGDNYLTVSEIEFYGVFRWGLVELVYDSDGDDQGLFYFLGTNRGTAVEDLWVNPSTIDLLTIEQTGSSFDPKEATVDRVANNAGTGNVSPSDWTFILPENETLLITKYSVEAPTPYNSSQPNEWELQGSNDGTTWDVLDFVAATGWDDTSSGAWLTRDVTGVTTPYNRFRLHMSGPNQYGGNTFFLIGELELYGTYRY